MGQGGKATCDGMVEALKELTGLPITEARGDHHHLGQGRGRSAPSLIRTSAAGSARRDRLGAGPGLRLRTS